MKFSKKFFGLLLASTILSSALCSVAKAEDDSRTADSAPQTRGALYLNVPFYEQETGDYCGPASVRSMYACIKNTSNPPSQSTLAASLMVNGSTTHANAWNYCKNTFTSDYTEWWKNDPITTPTALFVLTVNSVAKTKPVLAHIKGATTANWKYSSPGHYLVFSGYTDVSGVSRIQITDPWKKGHGIASGKYEESLERVYAVTDRIIYVPK